MRWAYAKYIVTKGEYTLSDFPVLYSMTTIIYMSLDIIRSNVAYPKRLINPVNP